MPIYTPPTWHIFPGSLPGQQRNEAWPQPPSRVLIPRRSAACATIPTEPTGLTSRRSAVRCAGLQYMLITTPPPTLPIVGAIVNYKHVRRSKQSRPYSCNGIRNGKHVKVGRSPTCRPVRSSTGVAQDQGFRQGNTCLGFWQSITQCRYLWNVLTFFFLEEVM